MRFVLLPGLDGTGALFSPLLNELPAGTPVTTVEYPAERVLDYDELSAFTTQHLPGDGGYVIVAESFSGPVAMKIAAQSPRGLRGIVLCATFTTLAGTRLQAARWLLPLCSPRAAPTAALSWLLMGEWSTPDLAANLERAIAAVPAEVIRARARAALEVDVTREAQALAVPVLFLRPSSDRLIPENVYRRTAAALPDADVRTVPGPHFLLQTAPHACAKELETFAGRR